MKRALVSSLCTFKVLFLKSIVTIAWLFTFIAYIELFCKQMIGQSSLNSQAKYRSIPETTNTDRKKHPIWK